MVPALFHTASAFAAGQSIAETRHASGEWLPAWILSLASVGCIALSYGMARRIGASRHESILAAALMWASGSMLMYARHLIPSTSRCCCCSARHGLASNAILAPRDPTLPASSPASGLLTYAGYWLGTLCVAILNIGPRTRSIPKLLASISACGLGIVTAPALLVIAAWWKEVNLIDGMRGFSRTVTHGEF